MLGFGFPHELCRLGRTFPRAYPASDAAFGEDPVTAIIFDNGIPFLLPMWYEIIGETGANNLLILRRRPKVDS